MEAYSHITNAFINTVFSLSIILCFYLFFVIFKHSPLTLGLYKYLLISNLILSNVCNLAIFLFKPVFVITYPAAMIQASGIAKTLPRTLETSYLCLELAALSLLLLAFSIFVSIFFRYQQMLPPSNDYMLNGTRVLKQVSVLMFLVFIIPDFLFLRLSRLSQEDINYRVVQDTASMSAVDEFRILDQDSLVIAYSGKLNFFFYVFLTWTAVSFFALLVLFFLFLINIYNAMNETFQRYLEETYRGQKLVFTVFSIQMASYICFLIFPVALGALTIINVLYLPSKGFEILLCLTAFYPLFDSLCVLYFIKAYRQFTIGLFHECLKIIRYDSYPSDFTWETTMKVLG